MAGTPNGSWHRRIWEDIGQVGSSFIPSTSSVRVQNVDETQFGESLVASRTPIIELNSAYGTSTLRDLVEVTGTGSKDDVNGTITSGEIYLSTGATAGSTSTVLSAEIARYIPGYSAEIGIGVRTTTVPTGDQVVTWGGHTYSRDNGFYFKYTASGLFIVRERNGVEAESIAQTDWNIDPMDGTGASGYTLDLTKGHIYQIDYTWYGYGAIRYSIVATTDNGRQRPIPVHTISIGTFTGTSISDPSLQLFIRAENNTTASDIDVYLGGRQYSIVGNYVAKYRFTGDTRDSTAVTTTLTPLVAFRHKAGFENRSLKLDNYSFINAGNIPVKPIILLGATLTGGTWGTPTGYTAADTGVESNISATAVSGGSVIYSGDIIAAAKDGGAALEALVLDIPPDSIVVIAATAFSGSQSCYTGFRLREEW
tara:strand:- start:332 stop:1603 length:1272 start_codon:yes stop_codon:yes gene_type:complete